MNALLRNVLIAACAVLVLAGCKKAASERKTQANPEKRVAATAILRAHWKGSASISSDTNSVFLQSILRKPESIAVRDQFLSKLALSACVASPESKRAEFVTNYIALLAANEGAQAIRNAAADLLEHECEIDVAQSTNKQFQFRFAVRLNENESQGSTNLTRALEVLCGSKITSDGALGSVAITKQSPFSRMFGDSFNVINMTQEGSWWVLYSGPSELHLEGMDRDPTNAWLTGYVDVERGFPLIGLRSAFGIKCIRFEAVGEGENMRVASRITVNSNRPLNTDPWIVPTNLVRDPLVSFTAVRGGQSLLSYLTNVAGSHLSGLPSQLYLWAREGVPLQTYFAMRPTDASNNLEKISVEVLPTVNAWMKTNGAGQFKHNAESGSISWVNAPFLKPFAQPGLPPYQDFLVGGLFVPMGTNPPPVELFGQLKEEPAFFYYDWELTGLRAEQLIDVSQLLRIAFHKAQIRGNSPGLLWIKSLAPALGNTVTHARVESPNEILVVRKGPVGFSAVELHLLIDWIESPDFPWAFHTASAVPPKHMRSFPGNPPLQAPAEK